MFLTRCCSVPFNQSADVVACAQFDAGSSRGRSAGAPAVLLVESVMMMMMMFISN